MVLFDAGMCHKAGPPGVKSRWGSVCYYGPWFMKPYYRFPDIIREQYGEDFIRTLTPVQRRLLHFNSTPPLNEVERFSTLMKEGENPLYDK